MNDFDDNEDEEFDDDGDFVITQDLNDFSAWIRLKSIQEIGVGGPNSDSMSAEELEFSKKIIKEGKEIIKAISLDEIITIVEIRKIIEKNATSKEHGKVTINLSAFTKAINEINSLIASSIFTKLSSAGKLECGWDEENNCMVFWEPD